MLTYPGVFEQGVSRIAQGRACSELDAVPMADGSLRSFSRLPLPFDTEELLLVTGHKGIARLTNRAEGYRVVIEWDPGVFPSMLLWISNRGRQYAPWSGRFLALGVEPVCAAFDLGYAHGGGEATQCSASSAWTRRSDHIDERAEKLTETRARERGMRRSAT